MKERLSEEEVTEVRVPSVYKGQRFALEVKRLHLEKIMEPFVDRAMHAIEAALDASGISVKDIDVVLLAGGSSRIPLFQRKVERLFGKEPEMIRDPDLCVAEGASLLAMRLSEPELFEEIWPNFDVQDVQPRSLGVEIIEDAELFR